MTKGAFTHPVSACVYCIALHFPSTYIGLMMSMEKKVITSKTQCNAANACGNRMWQLGLNVRGSSNCNSYCWLTVSSIGRKCNDIRRLQFPKLKKCSLYLTGLCYHNRVEFPHLMMHAFSTLRCIFKEFALYVVM